MFQLADRWGEADPRKIAALPADILTYWQAFFSLQSETSSEEDGVHTTLSHQYDDVDEQCNQIMRVLNG